MRLPKQDSATVRGIYTAGQSIVAFLIGLVLVVWQVDGVPETVITYTEENFLPLLVGFGLSAGWVSFVWNLLVRHDVKTY